MANPTEKTLNALLSSSLRIEKMMEKKQANEKEEAGKAEKLVSGVSNNFANLSKSLDSIAEESRKTNEILEKIYDYNSGVAEESTKLVSDSATAFEKLGGAWTPLLDAIESSGDVTEKDLNQFKNILLTLAFMDYKTGDPLVEKEQLEAAAKMISTLKVITTSILILGVAMVVFSFMLPQIAKGILGVAMIVATMTVTLVLMQKALSLTGKEKDIKDVSGPINSLVNLAKGIALFGLTMVLFSYVVPQIFKGILPFIAVLAQVTLALWLVNKVLNADGKIVDLTIKDEGPLGSLMRLGKAIALFGLMMVLFSFVIPQIFKGMLGFILVLSMVTLSLYLMNKVLNSEGLIDLSPKDKSPLGTLLRLAQAIALFSLTFVLIGYVIPQIAWGALAFLMIISALTAGLWIMHKVLGGAKFKIGKQGSGPIDSLWKLAKSIAAFSLIFVLLYYVQKQYAIGALMVLLTITALSGVLLMLSSNKVRKGSRNLRHIAISIIIITAALAIFGMFAVPKLGWEGLAMLGAVIVTLSLIGLILGIKPIDGYVKAGAINLILLAGALLIFSIAIAIVAKPLETLGWGGIAKLAAVIGVMALIGTLIGIPPIVGFVMAGAVALIALGGALTIFSLGLAIYANAVAGKMKMKDVGILAGVIGAMALIGSVVGIISPLVILGSGAMIVAGAALILITAGLAVFAAAKWKQKDSDMLVSALEALANGFMGGPMPGGLIAAFKFAAKAAARAVLMFVTVPPYILAGMALIPIAAGLYVFKKTKWTQKDSNSLNAALYGIVNGFVTALDGVNWWHLWWGVNSMKNVGNVLVGLAEGVQAFANLTFKEYAYDEETKQMKVVAVNRLTPKDIAMTGIAIGMVISAVTKPLAEFGEMMMGGGSDSFLGVNWGKLIAIDFGIKSLGNIGSGLVNLAQGVQDWANMTVTEWGIQQNKETGLNEIVPMNRRPIKRTEIESAMVNITDVLTAMAKPLSDFGEFFVSEQKGWFGSTYQVENKGLKLGIEGLATIGTGLVTMADAIAKWANMSYVEMTIGVNKETGLNELMPGTVKPIGKANIEKAKYNIGSVLAGLVYPLSAFGDMFTSTQKGWFGSTYEVKNEGLITGIEQMANIADGLSKLADMMGKWAFMEYTEMEVYKDKKTGQTKLQPKAVKKLGVGRLMLARFNIGLTLSTIGQAFMDYLDQTRGNGGPSGVNSLVEELVIQQQGLIKIGKYIEPWSDGKFNKSVMNFWSWVWIGRPIHTIGKATMQYVKLTRGSSFWNADWKFVKIIEEWGQVSRGFGDVAIYTDLVWNKPSRLMGAINFKMWMYTMSYPFMLKFMGTLARFGPISRRFLNYFRPFLKIPVMVGMHQFTKQFVILARHANRMEKFASAFERIAIAMGTFAKNFKLMNYDGIQAFQTWTQTLVTAVEVANEPSFFENALDKAGGVIETGFKIGEKLFGDGDKEQGKLPDEKKKSIIEATNEATEDEQMQALVSAVTSLQSEISGLKAALGGTMNVNVQSVSTTASIKTTQK